MTGSVWPHRPGTGSRCSHISSSITDRQSWSRQMVSYPAAQFSVLLFGCTDSLAAWMSSLCTERLANNLSALWGTRPTCQQRAQCFSGQLWRLEWSGHSAGGRKGVRKGSSGEWAVFLGLSKAGSGAQAVFCNSHSHLRQTKAALVAHSLPATVRWDGHKGTKVHKCENRPLFPVGHSQHTHDAKRAYAFFNTKQLCNIVPSFAGDKTNLWKSTDKPRKWTKSGQKHAGCQISTKIIITGWPDFCL